jgi:hypothetical protein
MRSSATTLPADYVGRGATAGASYLTGPALVSSRRGEGLAEVTATDHSVGVELVSLVVADAGFTDRHPGEWISVQLLAMASVLLPCVGTPFALPTVDVPASLREAALALQLCRRRPDAYRLADAADQMLARHLIDCYLAIPAQPGGPWILRDWLVMTSLPTVVAELQAAAWFNRLRLLAAEQGTDRREAHLFGGGWSGAAAVAAAHPFRLSDACGRGGQ